MSERKIHVSGLYSGPSPSAGVGVARAIRRGFEEKLGIIGVDYWVGSSGFHTPYFDDVWLMPDWDSIHEPTYVKQIEEVLQAEGVWLPTLDLEISWLRNHEVLNRYPSLLAPSFRTLEKCKKVNLHKCSLVEALKLSVPETLHLGHSDQEIYRFLRASSWKAWAKGSHHGAMWVSNWRSFLAARASLLHGVEDPVVSDWIIQKHINGKECSLAFAAYQGELLGLVRMNKKMVTPDGKTWAGRVEHLDPSTREFGALSEWIQEECWTGGGEIEMIQDFSEKHWINEINPRFPAWIFGAALAGVNLPGRLVERALGVEMLKEKFDCREFSRVVLEVPVNEEVGLPEPVELSDSTSVSKYGESLNALSKKSQLRKSKETRPVLALVENKEGPKQLPEPFEKAFTSTIQTPVVVHDHQRMRNRMENLLRKVNSFERPRVEMGYSIKTFAQSEHLRDAKGLGFFAEAISQSEFQKAFEMGFRGNEIVVNGPAKGWPNGLEWFYEKTGGVSLKAWFVDSVEELEECVSLIKEQKLNVRVLGLRLGLPQFRSRFGVDLGDLEIFSKTVGALRELPKPIKFGIHFHMASSAIGVGKWWDAFEAVLEWGAALESAIGRGVSVIDLGGGWHPEDFESLNLKAIHQRVTERLVGVEALFFEPGKALSQDMTALATRALEVRPRSSSVVLDACIAELPLANHYPHRVWAFNDQRQKWEELGFGQGRLMGRICMEDDFLATQIEVPVWIKKGTPFLILDAGAYERSMSYEFGRGKL